MKNKPLLAIFLVIFFDLLGFGVVIPILPYYVRAFDASALQLGWIMSIYSIAQFIFAPIWGSLSDRYGRKNILLLSIFGGACSLLFMGLATSFTKIFIARLFAGLFGANISTASAYIADNTTPENRAKGMGIIGAGFGLGFIFGPVLGGLLASKGYAVPILTASVLGFFNLFFCASVLKESKMNRQARMQNRRRLTLSFLRQAFAYRELTVPIVLFFVSTLAFSQLEMSFAWFVLERFQYGAKSAGILLGCMGLVMIVIQGGAIGKLAKKFGEKKLIQVGFTLMAIAMLGAGLSQSPVPFVIFLLLIAFSSGIYGPSLLSLLSRAAPQQNLGGMMGVYQSSGTLARIFGPLLAGFLFQHMGIAWPIYFSALVMFVSALYTYQSLKTIC